MSAPWEDMTGWYPTFDVGYLRDVCPMRSHDIGIGSTTNNWRRWWLSAIQEQLDSLKLKTKEKRMPTEKLRFEGCDNITLTNCVFMIPQMLV